MTVLVDTGVLYADHDTDAARHDEASDALDTLYDGEFGHPCITDYVFDEAITLTRKRTDSFEAAAALSDRLRGVETHPQVYELLHVSATVFENAVDVFQRYDDQALSFTDATIIAVMEDSDIDCVLSFDDDFDGLVKRIAPGDV